MQDDLLLSAASNEDIGRQLAKNLEARYHASELGKNLVQHTDSLMAVADAASTLFELSQGALEMAHAVRMLIGGGDRELVDRSQHYARALLSAASFAQVRLSLVRSRHTPGGLHVTA